MDDYIKTRFHHGGAFIKNGQDTLYVGEKEPVEVFDIDKDHFSMFELFFYSKDLGYLTVGGFYDKDSKTNDLLPVESDAHLFKIVKDMKNGEFLDLYVVHVVNEAEVVEEDVGLTNLLTGSEIGENNNVSGEVRAINVGDINTDHEVEKDLGEIENLEDINLEVDKEFGEASENVDVDVDIVDETEQYVEEHLDGVETYVKSSSDSRRRGFEDIGRNKAARYTGILGGDEDYIDSSEADSNDSKDELDPEAIASVDLPGRRKSTKLRIGRVQTSKSRSSSQPPTYRGSNETSTSSGVSRGKGVSGQKRGPINATGRAQKRSNNVGFGLYHDNRTRTQALNPGTSLEIVVIAASNIINTTPTNIDIVFKPPGLRWMGREAISTSQLQQMRNFGSGNL
ncbi:hypothetical protein HAX54_035284 [Datura stramonium]|uniref:PB1-like domain-containing protein n=1 Tax=Datura stramonium TaxID=4076 RepID=A0ABS8RM07_DATST|nr:hypothetical protein [Datura stramonium]